jgi:hypothetical protein
VPEFLQQARVPCADRAIANDEYVQGKVDGDLGSNPFAAS